MAIRDITKTGAQSYRDIQDQNNLDNSALVPWYELPASQRMQYHQNADMQSLPIETINYEQLSQLGNFGASKYDVDVPMYALENLEGWRARNQSAGRQWVHGITKGIGLAGTTFIDGTLALLYGGAEAIGTWINGGTFTEGASKLWDNKLSNALQDFNQKMEEWLPNYRTQEEQERNWWQNAGTANFWADGFLKNLGFSVGAFYSGNAWLKGLKALGWVKKAASAQAVGSLLSGFNEGRIEANNGQRDILNAQYKFIDDERKVMAQEIAANPYDSDEVKIQKLETLDDNVKIQKDKALERAHQAGMAILIGNTLILTADNMWQFGKLYSRGFTNAKGIMGRIEDGMMKQGIRGGIKEGGKYVAETVSKPRAILRGFSNAASEGFEELNQAAIAEGAGYWRGVDSPDAYYEALKDPKAQLQTKRFFEALGTGLTNTYGNGDRWEEFAIGFLTGAIGMPTFGSVNNADANTWVGKGKKIGISGGIVGEYRSQMQQSRENEESARGMNAYLDKLATNANYFSQSQSFTNAMDGFAASSNKFEYENMANNDDFAAISRFAKAGRLDDLKELVNQDFENMSDEQLADIAVNTTPNIIRKDDGTIAYEDINGNAATGGWRDATGKLMSETPEGREQMREDLKAKRDKILYEIGEYEKSVEAVRAISNNSLPDDQVNELAWLDWKGKMFSSRYGQIQKKQEENLTGMLNAAQKYSDRAARDIETYDGMVNAVKSEIGKVSKDINDTETTIETLRNNLKNSNDSQSSALMAAAIRMHRNHIVSQKERLAKLQDSYDNLTKNTNREKELEFGKYLQSIADEMAKFLSYIKGSTNPLQLASKIEANEKFISWAEDGVMKELLTSEMGITGEEYDRIMQDLKDTAMIAKAAKQFKERYDEFSKHPDKLVKNRQKIDKKKEKVTEVVNRDTENARIKSMTQNEIIKANNDGETTYDELRGMFPDDSEIQDMVNRAEGKDSVNQRLNEILDESDVAPQIIEDAKTLVANSFDVSQDEQEFLDLSTAAYQDLTTLSPVTQDIDISNEELQQEMQQRHGDALNLLSSSIGQLIEELDSLESTRASEKAVESATPKDSMDETMDGTTRTSPINDDSPQQKETDPITSAVEMLVSEAPVAEDLMNSYKNTLRQVVKNINDLKKSGHNYQETYDTLQHTPSWQELSKYVGQNPRIGEVIGKYFSDVFSNKSQQVVTEESGQEEVDKNYVPTDSPNTDSFNSQVGEVVTKQNDIINGDFVEALPIEAGRYMFWKPTATELPIHFERGNFMPFYKMARTQGRYTTQQLKRIEAVGEYLEAHGAFANVDNGVIQPGDKVGFTIDSALNENAGEVIILMGKLSEDGSISHILGDVMSASLSIAEKQFGLPEFTKRVIKEWEDAGKPDNFVSKEYSVVDKFMVGKIPFSKPSDRHSLNEIHTDFSNNPVPFKIGISMQTGEKPRILGTAGRAEAQGQSAFDRSIIPPLYGKSGQPFLLMPTGNSKQKGGTKGYVCVPITMPTLNNISPDTQFYRALREVVDRVSTSQNQVKKLKDDLLELLSLERLNINYGPDGEFTIKYKSKTMGETKTIDSRKIKSIQGGLSIEDTIMQMFQSSGVPIQVSRKYINGTYNGMDYNRMIGELAQTNLLPGFTHTMSDWFTIAPVKSDGTPLSREEGTRSAKSTGANPNAKFNYVSLPNGINVKVSLEDGTIEWDGHVETFNGDMSKGYNKAFIWAYGKIRNLDMTKPYSYSLQLKNGNFYGEFDPVNRKQITEQPEPTAEIKVETPVETSNMGRGAELLRPEQKLNITLNDETFEVSSVAQGAALAKLYEMYDKTDPEKFDELKNQILNATSREELEKIYKSIPMSAAAKTRWQENKDGILEGLRSQINGSESQEPIPSPSRPTTTTQENVEDKAIKMGLTSRRTPNIVWQSLPEDIKERLVSYDAGYARARLADFKRHFDFGKKQFKEPIESIARKILDINSLFREVKGSSRTFDLEKEKVWLSKVLPQFSSKERLQLIDGMHKMGSSEVVWGMFEQGVIKLNSRENSRGTVYHEAFHAVVNTLMTEEEINDLYKLAREKWGDIGALELEEKLAEDFRQYTEYEQYVDSEGLKGAFTKFWRKLSRMIKDLFGKEAALNRIYRDINQGKFASREVKVSEAIRMKDAELLSIKENAIANGTFMKAPNGKPTNLTERQWLQVRTKNFINWFGDWINDPSNASKVVDENGEPLVVYHGSRESFNTFRLDTKNRGNLTDIIKKGIYFSSERIAKQYASSKEKEDFFKLQEYEEAGYYFEEIAQAFGFNPRDEGELEAASKYLMELENSYGKFKNNLYAVFLNIKEPIKYDLNGAYIGSLTKEQRSNINDSEGAILYNVDETTGRYRGDITVPKMFVGTDYIIFNPNQVKSATDNVGNFSTLDDDIRYRVKDSTDELERLGDQYDALEQELAEAQARIEKEVDWAGKHKSVRNQKVYDKGKLIGYAVQDGSTTTSYYTKEDALKVLNNVSTIGYLFNDSTSNDNIHTYRVVVPMRIFSFTEAASSNEEIKEIRDAMEKNLYAQKELRHSIEIESSIEYDRLSAEDQMAVMNGGFTKEEYDEATLAEKRNILNCHRIG